MTNQKIYKKIKKSGVAGSLILFLIMWLLTVGVIVFSAYRFAEYVRDTKLNTEYDAASYIDRLYEEACGIIAGIQTEMARESSEIQAERMQAKLSRSDALYDYQKQEIIDRKRDSYQQASKENIGAADIEQWLFASVPKDTHGNLLPMKQSGLNEQFAGKRLNRQHIGEILAGKAPITRYDLITLHFFVFSQDIDRFRKMYASNALSRRYHTFVRETNSILETCDMGPLYIANPYESFILMCILAEDPLGAFADTIELSYNENDAT